MRYFIILIVLSSTLKISSSLYLLFKEHENEALQITLQNGCILQGRSARTSSGLEYNIYQGIPYAAAPVGKRRFQPPQPPPIWDGILDATQDGEMCTQITNKDYIGSEDCLFINVATRKYSNSTNLLPVMVWIHGGGFVTGDSKPQTYGPDYLLEKDVLVVTFNYRLGIFGFLSTEDMHSPGNYGIKDQIAALRWVQVNIDRFGGDPRQVTIFGESAGAASVSYLLLAPKAKGLFHSAISESGSALCPWGLQRSPKNIAFQVGTVLGILTLSSQDLVNRLRTVDAKELHNVATSAAILNLFSPLNGLAYSPSIEPKHADAILSQGSHELFRTGQFIRVPYIIGFNSEESSILQEMVDFTRPYLLSYDILPINLIPDDLNINKLSIGYVQAGLKIKNKYFGSWSPSISSKEAILKFISDLQFVKPIHETVKLISQYSPVYFYEFSYEGKGGFQGANLDKTLRSAGRFVAGVGHSEEMWYLWKRDNLTLDNKYDQLQKNIFTTLWTNFGKYSNPTPKMDILFNNIIWPQSDYGNDYTLLNIGKILVLESNPRAADIKFWDELYEEYGNPPYTTY